MQQLLLVCVIFGLASRVVANGEGRSRTPRIAVVNSQPFHLEIVAGLVDATAPFRDTTTYFLDPAVFPRGDRNLGFIPWIQDVKCERAAWGLIAWIQDVKCERAAWGLLAWGLLAWIQDVKCEERAAWGLLAWIQDVKCERAVHAWIQASNVRGQHAWGMHTCMRSASDPAMQGLLAWIQDVKWERESSFSPC